MLLWNFIVCGKVKSTFTKNQELHNFNIFIDWKNLCQNCIWNSHDSAWGPLTKRKMIQKFIKTGGLKHLYRNELDRAWFVPDTAYSDSKDLPKITISDKILIDTVDKIARHRQYHGYQRSLTSMVYKFFLKTTWSGISVNEELAGELHKPLIKKFKRRRVYERFKDNIQAADLTEKWSFSF